MVYVQDFNKRKTPREGEGWQMLMRLFGPSPRLTDFSSLFLPVMKYFFRTLRIFSPVIKYGMHLIQLRSYILVTLTQNYYQKKSCPESK